MTPHTVRWGLSAWVIAAVGLSACAPDKAPSANSPAATAPAPMAKADAVPDASPAVVLPGQDVTTTAMVLEEAYRLPGFFRASVTLDDLRARFGAANVRVTQIAGAEGATAQGVVLFADDPKRRAELLLREGPEPRGVAMMRVSGKDSRWHLDNTVRLGMTLDELVALNGKPITFSGLDWDYGGTVSDWHEGRLAPRAGDPVFRAVTLTHDTDPPEGAFPLGDGEYRSDDPNYPRQGTVLHVGALQVTF
jgi:hypothetical protein